MYFVWAFQLAFKYLSGEMGTSGCCPDTAEKVVSNFSKFDISSTSHTSSKEDKEPCLWLGCRETEGNIFLFYSSFLFLTWIISFSMRSILFDMYETSRFKLHIPRWSNPIYKKTPIFGDWQLHQLCIQGRFV